MQIGDQHMQNKYINKGHKDMMWTNGIWTNIIVIVIVLGKIYNLEWGGEVGMYGGIRVWMWSVSLCP